MKIFLILFIFIIGVFNQCEPECRYQCDDPICLTDCVIDCKLPNCTVNSTNSEDRMIVPTCHVYCSPNQCAALACPECEIICEPVPCENCEILCQEIQCDWLCYKPTNCPLPTCILQCEQSPCAGTAN